MDWAAEGLLDGLEDSEREARVRLLDALRADGVGIDELRAAVADDRLVLVPIERALMKPPVHTLAELAGHAGVDVEVVVERLRAFGVTTPDPETVAFSEDDLEAIRRSLAYDRAGLDRDELRALTHLLSGLMARAAEPVRTFFAQSYLEPGVTEDELGLRYGRMAAELLPLAAADLDYLYRLHLRSHVRSDAIGLAARTSGKLPETQEVAVAFSDIVGFTALGEELASEELSEIAGRLEQLADEHVREPARLVKTIGDAVMLVSRDAPVLVETMADLMDGASSHLPSLRTGIAYGRAVPRLGDWYGPAVNLAARLTARARADSVLVTTDLRDALGDAAARYSFSDAGAKRLKGITEPVPVLRLRRAEEARARSEMRSSPQ